MERSRIIISVVVIAAAVFLIWRVGLYHPEPQQRQIKSLAAAGPNEPNKGRTLTDVNEAKRIAEANEPERLADANWPRARGRLLERMERDQTRRFAGFEGRRGPGRWPRGLGDVNKPAGGQRPPGTIAGAYEPNRPGDSNEPREALNLKNVEMKYIVQKISEWTGKTVIPSDEVLQQKITIYAPQKLPRNKALSHIYGALRMKGIVAEQTDDAIYLSPVKDGKLNFVPTVKAGQPLAMMEDKNQIVQKFFKLENYSPAQMGQIIQPLISEYGYVSADESTGNLLVIDTVANLIRIERIITEFDVPEAEQAVTKIFEVHYGDPSEIVQMLNILLGESKGYSKLRREYKYASYSRERGGSSLPSPKSSHPVSSSVKKAELKSKAGAAASVVVGTTRGPIVLIPEPRRKWIIARASAEDMKQIEQWIQKLDMEEPVESEYEVVQLRYADPREVENSIEDGFRDLPGTEFLPSVLIQPLQDTRQVIVFGRKDLREIVKKMIEEIDVPPGQFETAHIKLKYADPDEIKEKIEELYGGTTSGTSSRFFGGYPPWYRRSSSTSSETVKVISYVSLKQITVIASTENMEKIRQQIEEWDAPLDVNAVKPRVIELQNSDPVQMADLLNKLFSEQSTSGRVTVMDIFRGVRGFSEVQGKIVGPLYGQLTFEDVPGTKKIIVISKIPEAYEVIEQLILELDRQEMAEIPKVITLKYADPEDLAQRLNAMFCEQGTAATIQFREQGLSEFSWEEEGGSTSSVGQSEATPAEYKVPWSTGRQSTEQMPISNVIGRIRFIPDPRSKSILCLAPPQFMSNIEQMVTELDVPGKQVMIEAIIVEIDHSQLTSLGVQLSTNPEAFGTLEENAIRALGQLTHLATHGTMTPSASAALGVTGTGTILGAGVDVYALIDFLIKKTDAKILNQQTLWTKDNEEAMFFKGEEVAFLKGAATTVGVTTQDIEFEKVGMTLQARPSITPEKNVDMIISVQISQLTSELVNNQPVRSNMQTTTNMIVEDGQTILLGGILFQKDSTVKRKIPLFGDTPVVGGLFRHNETIQSNEEMLVFITPYVIADPNSTLPATIERIQRPKKKLEKIREQLRTSVGAGNQKMKD